MFRSRVRSLFVLLLPFTFFTAQSQGMKTTLQGEYDLTAKYKVGDTDYYRLRSLYLDMGDSGWVKTSTLLEGYYQREVVAVDSKEHTDRFTWKGVRVSARQGRGEFSDFSVLDFSKGYRSQFSVREISGKHFPADIAPIPKTPQGFQFFVKLVDASTFDIIREFERYGKPLTRIGQATSIPAEDLQGIIDFPPLYTNTSFQHSATIVTFRGITITNGIPCAIIEFREDNSHIHMTMNMMKMEFPSDGTSYYWGTILLSLETGKIVSATLLENVITMINLSPIAPPTRSLVRRELTLETLDKRSYEGVEIETK